MKSNILNILRDEKNVVSGEILSDRLGVSRVSIWKHIKKLQEIGYPIEATSKGYCLISAPDVLYPWEFGNRESKIHYFDAVDSTMDVARGLARNNCPPLYGGHCRTADQREGPLEKDLALIGRRALFYNDTQAENTAGSASLHIPSIRKPHFPKPHC